MHPRRPLIGVISDRRKLGHHPFHVVGEKYLTAIVQGAGGYPVAVPVLADDFDVLLTDLRMPVMDGIELLQHCSRLPDSQRPGRVIAISGEYDSGVLKGQPVQFMPKPFDVHSLLDMLSGKPN